LLAAETPRFLTVQDRIRWAGLRAAAALTGPAARRINGHFFEKEQRMGANRSGKMAKARRRRHRRNEIGKQLAAQRRAAEKS
jgi:hypothetical protein